MGADKGGAEEWCGWIGRVRNGQRFRGLVDGARGLAGGGVILGLSEVEWRGFSRGRLSAAGRGPGTVRWGRDDMAVAERVLGQSRAEGEVCRVNNTYCATNEERATLSVGSVFGFRVSYSRRSFPAYRL
jgi:hypothetical protein